MAQYADSTYYTDTYGGDTIPEDDLDKYLQIASDKIDSLTYNRIVYKTFDKLTEFQQGIVQKACCLYADYKYGIDNGSDDAIEGNITSYSVLDISVSVDNKNVFADRIKNNYGIDERTYNCLMQSGLMCGVI